MSRLLLVRHGNTKLNKPKGSGERLTFELSADGIRQAEKLRDRLADADN